MPLSLSTLADQVGVGAAALMPLFKRLEAHVLAASRLHGDDTTVPVLAGKTDTGRLWTYVRDDRPFGGADPPAPVFYYSRDRRGEHPAAHLAGWSGILQADAFGGYGDLYATGRQPAPVLESSCWGHSRRKVFELADVEAAARKKAHGEKPNLVYPLAVEAVKRIDALFDIERAINGLLPAQRHAVRQERSAPLVILHPVPRRWADLPIQQCSRASPARHRSRKKVLAVLRFRSRRTARCRSLQPDGQRQVE